MNNEEPKAMEELEAAIGYTFRDRATLTEALTHSSYHNEMKAKGDPVPFNERLEFLGDSVLSIIVSSYLFEHYAAKQEGDLTKIRAAVVCEKALARYAAKISLGDYLFLGRGEAMTDGRHRPSITADAFEALLAAIYLDSGETFGRVTEFLMPFIIPMVEEVSKIGVIDYKSSLQQIVQSAAGEILDYVLVDEQGPDHNKQFTVEARLNSNVIGRGVAKTKREAEQKAAREALILFGELHE